MMKTEPTYPQTYYVYTLAYPDGNIFYVGKGTNGRVADHEREAIRGCRCRKCHVIRRIWEDGKPIQKRIVFETLDEQEAFEHEKTLIALHSCSLLVNIKDNTYVEVLEEKPEVIPEPLEVFDQCHLTEKEIPIEAKEAAEMLNLLPRTVIRLAQEGEITGFKAAGVWRFYRSSIEAYIQRQIERARQQPPPDD